MAEHKVSPIHGHAPALRQWAIDAGLISADDRVYRIVIDIKPTDVVRVYVEKLGDTRLLDVTPLKIITGEEI